MKRLAALVALLMLSTCQPAFAWEWAHFGVGDIRALDFLGYAVCPENVEPPADDMVCLLVPGDLYDFPVPEEPATCEALFVWVNGEIGRLRVRCPWDCGWCDYSTPEEQPTVSMGQLPEGEVVRLGYLGQHVCLMPGQFKPEMDFWMCYGPVDNLYRHPPTYTDTTCLDIVITPSRELAYNVIGCPWEYWLSP